MTTETKVTLDKVAELDGGGARLAVQGALIAAGTDDGVMLWRDHRREAALDAPATIDRLRFRNDGKELLAAPHALEIPGATWAALGDLQPALLHGLEGPSRGELRVRRADWSADGQELLVYVEHRPARGLGTGGGSGSPQARLLWMDRGRQVLAVPWTGRSFALNSVVLGNRWAAAAGKELLVWDRRTRAQVATMAAHTLVIRDLAFSADEHLLASVGNDHKVVIVDTTTWKATASWDAHDGDAVGVAFHPTLPLIATTGQDGRVRVWTLAGKRVAEANLGRAGNAVAFSSDGKQLLVATDEHVVIFAVKAG
jgi:hypothetical protein